MRSPPLKAKLAPAKKANRSRLRGVRHVETELALRAPVAHVVAELPCPLPVDRVEAEPARWQAVGRVDTEPPYGLQVDPADAETPHRLSVHGAAAGQLLALEIERIRTARVRRARRLRPVRESHGCLPSAVLTDTPLSHEVRCHVDAEGWGRWTCGLRMGKAGTVALDTVDPRSAMRTAAKAQRKNTSPLRRKKAGRVRPSQLSLSERLLLALQPPLELMLDPSALFEWPEVLYRYQKEGVAALVATDRQALLLADDMGLGKTIQAIAALRILIHWRRITQALIVVPASLLTQWNQELERWAPELRATIVRGTRTDRQRLWRARSHVFLVSYETLRQDRWDTYRGAPGNTRWDVVVLDEAQKIKNQRSQAARTCKALTRRRSWALTGTPLENDLNDLVAIIDFLTKLQPRLYYVDEIQEHLRTLQLRRRKADVLHDLPDKSIVDVPLELGARQRKTYDRAERTGVIRLKKLGKDVTLPNALALIQQLKQICNVCPTTGGSAKLNDLADRLEEIAAEGQRALVFSQYVDNEYGVAAIVKRLEHLKPLAYHGGLRPRQREEVISTFKQSSDHKVLVLSLRAGGQGLNLQEASYVIHFDRWWNPAVERQAEDRTHRLGQKNAVTVYRYICENTIEEKIDRLLRKKQDLFDQYVDHVSIDAAKLFGEEDIFALLGLEPPPRRGRSARETLKG